MSIFRRWRAAEDLGAASTPGAAGEFLKRLGIETRAVTLMAKTTPEVSENFRRAEAADRRRTRGMGSMFKVSRSRNRISRHCGTERS